MEDKLPPPYSIVCVDNTIVFKAVYNPNSIVTRLFDNLILERSCTLYSTEANLRRCQEAVERKILRLVGKILKERNPEVEHLKRFSFIMDALEIAKGKIRKGSKSKKFDQDKAFKTFTDELIEHVRNFVLQRFNFVKNFFELKDFSFYKAKFVDAISILGDKEPDHEDAHILALALTLHEQENKPVYLWTDDTDFYGVEQILKGYGVIPFKKVEGDEADLDFS